MANLSPLTRNEQVAAHLIAAAGEWVDGPEIANEAVGGSSGDRRFRELREEDDRFETRRHPDPARDVWQYRFRPGVNGLRVLVEPVKGPGPRCPICKGPLSPLEATLSSEIVRGRCTEHGWQTVKVKVAP